MISCSFWCSLLARCRYYLIFKLHLGGTCSTNIIRAVAFRHLGGQRCSRSIALHSELRKARSEGPISSWMRRIGKYSSKNGISTAARCFSMELGRGLLAKLKLAKFLRQYKARAFGEIFLPRNFCRIRYSILIIL